jgi:hypothetical protein
MEEKTRRIKENKVEYLIFFLCSEQHPHSYSYRVLGIKLMEKF